MRELVIEPPNNMFRWPRPLPLRSIVYVRASVKKVIMVICVSFTIKEVNYLFSIYVRVSDKKVIILKNAYNNAKFLFLKSLTSVVMAHGAGGSGGLVVMVPLPPN